DIGEAAGQHLVAHLQAVGREDVGLLAVSVVEQRNTRRAVRIVLDGGHHRGHTDLLATEVDDAIAALVAAATEAAGDATVVVAAAGVHLVIEQLLQRLGRGDVALIAVGVAAATSRCRIGLLDGHGSLLAGFIEEGDVIARAQRDDGLLPVGSLAFAPAHALDFAALDQGVYAQHFDAEHRFDGAADLDLVRAAIDLEHDLIVFHLQPRGFL